MSVIVCVYFGKKEAQANVFHYFSIYAYLCGRKGNCKELHKSRLTSRTYVCQLAA